MDAKNSIKKKEKEKKKEGKNIILIKTSFNVKRTSTKIKFGSLRQISE